MAKKVYAIQYGFDSKKNEKVENIIVNTWTECLTYVKGVKGAKYKSFESVNEANDYLSEGNRMLKKADNNYPKDCIHAYVDGSYNASEEKYSFGLVCVKDEVIIHIDGGAEKSNTDNNIRQIAGELKGALKAAEYGLKNGESKIVIFHDYEGIAHHATGAWSRKEASSIEYYEKMQELMKKGIEIIFVKVDSHTGDLYNELVDEVCKSELGIQSDKVVEKWLSKNKLYVLDDRIRQILFNIVNKSQENIVLKNEGNISSNNKNKDSIGELVQIIKELSEENKIKLLEFARKLKQG